MGRIKFWIIKILIGKASVAANLDISADGVILKSGGVAIGCSIHNVYCGQKILKNGNVVLGASEELCNG